MPVLSAKIGGAFEETDPTGGYIHMILPDGIGGYDSYVISVENFQSLIQDQVDDIVASIGTKRSDLNQSASYNFGIDAGTKIVGFALQWVSGTVNVDIGTTNGGTEIFEGFDISSGVEDITLNKSYDGAETIYITRNSGTFNLFTIYIPNFLT